VFGEGVSVIASTDSTRVFEHNGRKVTFLTDPQGGVGVWVERADGSCLCLIDDIRYARAQGVYVGYFRDLAQGSLGCDLAIAVGGEGKDDVIQVVRAGEARAGTSDAVWEGFEEGQKVG
jgi:hypothetical protein